MELESGFLPTPAGSAALSVSWRARSRQIRDHHRAQRRGSSRRYKRRLTLLQEGVSWLYSLLCSAPLRALEVVTQQGPGLSEIAFIHALLRQSMTRSARRYHAPYLVIAQYCNEQTFCPDIRRPRANLSQRTCSRFGSQFGKLCATRASGSERVHLPANARKDERL